MSYDFKSFDNLFLQLKSLKALHDFIKVFEREPNPFAVLTEWIIRTNDCFSPCVSEKAKIAYGPHAHNKFEFCQRTKDYLYDFGLGHGDSAGALLRIGTSQIFRINSDG